MSDKNLDHLIGFYLVNERPVKIHRLSDGLTATVLDVRTGKFSHHMKYIFDISFGQGDIEKISEDEYNKAIQIRLEKSKQQ
jgi:hypothetical protein